MTKIRLTAEEIRDLINRYNSEMRKLSYQMQNVQDSINTLETALKDIRSTIRPIRETVSTPERKAPESAPEKRRGRPPKGKSTEKESAAEKPKKRRGRPPKKEKPQAKSASNGAQSKKRRGRPPKAKTTSASASSETQPKKRRGRPPKTNQQGSKKRKPRRGYRLSEWDQMVLETLKNQQKALVFSDFMKASKSLADAQKLDEKAQYRKINQSLHKLANKRDALKKVKHSGRGFAYALPDWVNNTGNLKRGFSK